MEEKLYLPTIDDMIELAAPSDAQISPDGEWVAYLVSKPDWDKNERTNQLWLTNAGKPEPHQLTFAKGGCEMPRWTPDGKWITFLSRRNDDKTPQLYRISPFGGEAQRLGELNGQILAYSWQPLGKYIALALVEGETDALKKRKEKFGDFRVEDKDYQRAGLWLLDVDTKKAEKLMGGDDIHIANLDWSPDGKQIAFEALPTPDMKDFTNGMIIVFSLDTHATRQLTGLHCSTPLWSPDGRQIVYLQYGDRAFLDNPLLLVVDAGGGEPRVISQGFEETPMLIDWGSDGVYFAAMQRTGIHLFRIDPGSGTWMQVSPADPGWLSFSCSLSANARQIATCAHTSKRFGEVLLIDPAQGSNRTLTDFEAQTASWKLGRKELFQWVSVDGTPIDGVLTMPIDFDPAKRYPLLVVIHGGPTWLSTLSKLWGPECFFYPCQQWAAKGALILEPNYRGSGGYGKQFRNLNVRNLGLGDYWDVISGVDALIEKGWVDGERVGSMGWSQGGYISAFITTFSDRFRAVSVGAGISNWVTYYVNTDIHPFTRMYLEATPWEDPEVYQKTSPMTYIHTAKTPTLIQHGDQDARVPIPNAFELYQGLLDMGVEAKLIVYPGMPHLTNKPRIQRQIMQSNFEWFNRWIWNETPAVEKENVAYVVIAHGEKNAQPENLPANERYLGKQVQDVLHRARRDAATFYIFSGEFGLVGEDFPSPPQERALLPEEVSPMSIRLAETLRDGDIHRIVFYTPETKKNPWVLIYLGCLQVTAGMLGRISIEQHELDEENWQAFNR